MIVSLANDVEAKVDAALGSFLTDKHRIDPTIRRFHDEVADVLEAGFSNRFVGGGFVGVGLGGDNFKFAIQHFQSPWL